MCGCSWEQGLPDQRGYGCGAEGSAGPPGAGWSWRQWCELSMCNGSRAYSCTHFLVCLHTMPESRACRAPDRPSNACLPRGVGNQGCSEKQLAPRGAAAQEMPGARRKERPRVMGTQGKEAGRPHLGRHEHPSSEVQELTTNHVKQKGIYECALRRNERKYEQGEEGSRSRRALCAGWQAWKGCCHWEVGASHASQERPDCIKQA